MYELLNTYRNVKLESNISHHNDKYVNKKSRTTVALLRSVEQVNPSLPVLITGETGVGAMRCETQV